MQLAIVDSGDIQKILKPLEVFMVRHIALTEVVEISLRLVE